MNEYTFPLGGPGFPVNPKRNLPVFTQSPNWKSGILERLSWMTDVMSSESAVEQRRSVRRYPRRSFEASFLRAESGRSRLDFFFTSIGRSEFLMPMWHEQYTLKGPQPTGAGGLVQFPPGTLEYREFRLLDMVLVSTADASKFTIVTVVERNDATGTITLQHRDAETSWPEGTRITPLRACRFLDAPQLGNRSDRVGVATVRFELSDADKSFTPSFGYCAPLWPFVPDRKKPVDFTYERSDYLIDMQTGVMDVADPGGRAQITESLDVTLYGRERIAAFRAFLYATRGRAVRFYLPSYTHDLQPTSDLGGAFFNAKVNGFSQYMDVPQEARKIIGIVFSDGAPTVYRTIVSVLPVADAIPPYNTIYERFQVDTDLPPIAMGAIERIMFVMPSRFDQDTIELNHPTDNGVAIMSSLVMRSCVVDGMPPIECWVTSRPYPVDEVDAITPTLLFTGGSLRPVSSQYATEPEAINSTLLFTGGTLRSLLTQYAMEPEAINSTVVFTGGTLRSILRAYDSGYEAMDINATLLDGTLKAVLIVYDRYAPEAMEVSGTLLGGTLT